MLNSIIFIYISNTIITVMICHRECLQKWLRFWRFDNRISRFWRIFTSHA